MLKIEGNRKKLLEVFSSAAKATKANTPIQSLECLLIEANESKLKVSGTDSVFGIITGTSDVKIESVGSVLVKANLILGCLKKMTSKEIKLEEKAGSLSIIENGEVAFEIPISKVENFPEIPKIKGTNSFAIDGESFNSLISKVSYACATGETNRVATKAVCFEAKNKRLYARAVDGYRLAEAWVDTTEIVDDFKFLIFADDLKRIQSFLKKNAEIKISFNSRHSMFITDSVIIVCRTLAADELQSSFEKYFVKKDGFIAELKAKEFTKAIDKVSVVVDILSKNPVVIKTTENGFDMSLQSTLGKSYSALESKVEKYTDVTIGCNSKYLSDAFSAMDEDVTIEISGSTSPIILRGNNVRSLVLPVRIK